MPPRDPAAAEAEFRQQAASMIAELAAMNPELVSRFAESFGGDTASALEHLESSSPVTAAPANPAAEVPATELSPPQETAAEAAGLAQASTPPALSAELVQEIRAVITPFTDEFIAGLPAEMADSKEVRDLVEQTVLKEAARILAAGGARDEA